MRTKKYKVYAFGMYSRYGVYSSVRDVNRERLEETRQSYSERGFDCGNVRDTPLKTTDADYHDVYTPL